MKDLKVFESIKIRSQWDAQEEKWYFSVIDVIQAFTDSPRARKYWNALKTKLIAERSQLSQNMGQLKMQAEDGKFYKTDVADTEQLFRLIQSIPSPKAEPFKQWLAKVGYERLEEIQDPELSINRAMENYLNLGYSKDWINQRLKSIEVRKDLTNVPMAIGREKRGVKKGQEFATLTDIITSAWSGKSVKEYKAYKGLKKENLRDNMTNLELVLNMLAEATTTEISKENKPATFNENKKIAMKGGEIAGFTRQKIEAETGKKIVSPKNSKTIRIAKNRGEIE